MPPRKTTTRRCGPQQRMSPYAKEKCSVNKTKSAGSKFSFHSPPPRSILLMLVFQARQRFQNNPLRISVRFSGLMLQSCPKVSKAKLLMQLGNLLQYLNVRGCHSHIVKYIRLVSSRTYCLRSRCSHIKYTFQFNP
jgi:hypothetical protein